MALQRLSLDTLGFLAKKCEGSSESGDDLTKHDGVLTMAVRIMGWHEADVAVQRAGCVLLLGMLVSLSAFGDPTAVIQPSGSYLLGLTFDWCRRLSMLHRARSKKRMGERAGSGRRGFRRW